MYVIRQMWNLGILWRSNRPLNLNLLKPSWKLESFAGHTMIIINQNEEEICNRSKCNIYCVFDCPTHSKLSTDCKCNLQDILWPKLGMQLTSCGAVWHFGSGQRIGILTSHLIRQKWEVRVDILAACCGRGMTIGWYCFRWVAPLQETTRRT